MQPELGPIFCQDIYSLASECLAITYVFRDELAAGGDAPYSPPEIGFNGWIEHLQGTVPPPPVGLTEHAAAWGSSWPTPTYDELVQMMLEVRAELATPGTFCAYYRDRSNDPGKPAEAQRTAEAGWTAHSRLMHQLSYYYGWLGRYRFHLRRGDL